jgi:hypothetical protein
LNPEGERTGGCAVEGGGRVGGGVVEVGIRSMYKILSRNLEFQL